MDFVEKQRAELLKILQELKQSVLSSIEFSIENIEKLQIDTYFSAEDSLEKILIGLERLEEDFKGAPGREKLKQLETRLFFLEERLEETDSEMRQRPARKKHRRINLFQFFRMSQEGPGAGEEKKYFSSPEEAFALFDLPSDTPMKVITARFRKLAKELHPDSNGGDRSHEPKLRNLIAAYQHLKEHFASR